MKAQHRPQGRLIAVDGSGARVAAAAKHLARGLRGADMPGAVSGWDSSGIFFELRAGGDARIPGPSARTLTLLYAADLAFRLRWQIRPALEEGRTVVAAPYVETAKAFGIAAGLPRRWLDELFRFAPRPHVWYHVAGRRASVARAEGASYVECFLAAALASPHAVDPGELRKRAAGYLAALERRRGGARLSVGVAAPARRRAPR